MILEKDLKERPLGVFDSGVGGLTVVKEIRKMLSKEDIIYLGDTARCPYGPKPLNLVKRFAIEISDYLVAQNVKALVVACNTASAAALEDIKARYKNLIVVGVVIPGARAAVKYTKNKKVGVIGTIGTISSGAYEKAIRELDREVQIFSKATPDFVDFVERGEVSGPRIEAQAHQYLDDLLQKGIDVLILGCTHYPLLIDTLRKVVGSAVRLVSSAEETVKELQSVLKEKKLLTEKGKGSLKLLATNGGYAFLSSGRRFLDENITEVETVYFGQEVKR